MNSNEPIPLGPVDPTRTDDDLRTDVASGSEPDNNDSPLILIPEDSLAGIFPEVLPDERLYLPNNDEWDVRIKRDSIRECCFAKHPGEDWFHGIVQGEIFLARQHEVYCLRCALRLGYLTRDRLFWQKNVPRNSRVSIFDQRDSTK